MRCSLKLFPTNLLMGKSSQITPQLLFTRLINND